MSCFVASSVASAGFVTSLPSRSLRCVRWMETPLKRAPVAPLGWRGCCPRLSRGGLFTVSNRRLLSVRPPTPQFTSTRYAVTQFPPACEGGVGWRWAGCPTEPPPFRVDRRLPITTTSSVVRSSLCEKVSKPRPTPRRAVTQAGFPSTATHAT